MSMYQNYPNQLQASQQKEQWRDELPKANGAVSVDPVTPLQERAKQLAHEFDELEAVIVALWSKLHPFLYDGQPAMEDKIPAKDAPHSRVWEELNNASARVAHNRIVLAQLLERIEV